MKRLNRLFTCAALMLVAAQGQPLLAAGWPAAYEGVMLQGFYWDSYDDTKWTALEARADELSKYFKLIWVPNSGYAGGHNNMGYMPQYWFTNHNSSFGTESELLSMISTYKAKGTGFIADCVINHRNGVSNWTDFPTEQWNGRTWQIGPDGICSTDEVRYASGQPTPTGAPDTGDDFDGCRDLDHTNANVQDNCKNYVKCLQEKYGYAGMRYDMVKGYGGEFVKIYNQYAGVQYSVGEYWDGQYDAVAGWIEATGRTSAAFDFPCKYAINEAFASGDMTKLVWLANGVTPQPAGMIHFGYPQYAVTFVDNHDTYRDGSKFTGNVAAANAFILLSPGTPCVFLPHYEQYRSEIQTLIRVRNAVGVSNTSAVNVLQSTGDCYMAEVTGSKGKVVVKVGPAMVSPAGYADSDIACYGTDYCVWTKTKVEGGDDDTTVVLPESLYVIGHVNGGTWAPDNGVALTKTETGFQGEVALSDPADPAGNAYFSFAKRLASDWDGLNVGGNRFAPASADQLVAVSGPAQSFAAAGGDAKAFYTPAGTYTMIVDWATQTVRLEPQRLTEVELLPAAAEVAPIYYTLQGQRVDTPTSGLYIMVKAGTTSKVMLP